MSSDRPWSLLLDRAPASTALASLANLRWRRSSFFIGFWGPEFVLFILLAFRLIVRENDDRFFFHEPSLQFLLLKNNLQCSFEGHISQFNAEPVLLDRFVEFYTQAHLFSHIDHNSLG